MSYCQLTQCSWEHYQTNIMGGTRLLRWKLLGVAGLTFCMAWCLLQMASEHQEQVWKRILAGLFGVPSILVTVLSLWMSTLRISYGHGLVSSYLHVTIISILLVTRFPVIWKCKKAWKNPRKSQEEYLKEIIKANAQSEYSKDFGLCSVTSLADLRKKHALTDYERYRPYVDRLEKGETGLLACDPVIRFALTSGTTGKAKMVPYTKLYQKNLFRWVFGILFDVRANYFGHDGLQRELFMYTAPKVRHSEGGVLMAPASVMSKTLKRLLFFCSTPAVGYDISDPIDSVYVHLLFGLRDPNLRSINAHFTSNLMSAMRMIEQKWPEFVRDIELGTVTTTNVPPDIHRTLVKELGGGDHARATELKKEFQKGFEGIMKRVWPHMRYVHALDSIGLKDALVKSYAKGLTLYGGVFGASEGIFGFNLWPNSTGKDEFVLMPCTAIYEFIPQDKITEDQPETFFIDELQVGGIYEVVITQVFGFYRFRYGDVIRVRRFHFNAPVVEFMYRSGQILNVHAEKLDQHTVKSAMDAAVGHWPGVSLEEYAVAESTLLDQLVETDADHRPYYVVFLELLPPPERDSMDSITLEKVDEELCHHSFTYNSFREKGTIAPPLVHIVKPGAFVRLHTFILNNSTTSANQYKVPRKLRTKETLQLMLDNSIYHGEVNACSK
ncbi:4-substituted benzoates-glutamate ligase GH3.12-like [Lytechinus variegatus]|uniref:4-substituted benzoates-glutamate ligase GH3.12-like n=1 Tax=Lytechinus variegatus TaxID=7654 RepID=UPI001BB12D25|nr:4-substituted benzoates-glutamate ligase GH3.12-like [Lytechinus variegatus]